MTHTPDFLSAVQTPAKPGAIASALKEIASVLGAERVIFGDGGEYRDPFQPVEWSAFTTAGVVHPDTVEHVQLIVRIAAKYDVPIWAQSQGRNNGYGGAAPGSPAGSHSTTDG